jgi:hypothetical protein
MKQYRYTSEHFVLPGETGDTDAVMDAKDLRELKRLAGLSDLSENSEPGLVGGKIDNVPQAQAGGIASPVGSNISHTATDRNELMQKYHARPGDELWFIINFTKPNLNGSVEDHIKRYLKAHPEKRQKLMPGES